MKQLFDYDAERGIIGCALINSDVLQESSLSASEFHNQVCSEIWSTMQRLSEDGQCDIVALDHELLKSSTYNEKGGLAYLSSCTNNVTTVLSAPSYVEIIKDLAKRRAILHKAEILARIAHQDSEVDQELSVIIDQLVLSAGMTGGAEPVKKFAHLLAKDVMEKYSNPQDTWGMATSFKDFDRLTGGLQQSESMILSGKSGVGKSMLACQMAMQLAMNGFPGVIFSIEMPGINVVRRLVSGLADILSYKLKTGKLNEGQLNDFHAAIGKIEKLSDAGMLFMCDKPDISLLDIRSELAKLKLRHNIKWFLADYFYLLKDARNYKDENAATTAMSRMVKSICRSLDLSGIMIHSKNKADEIRGSQQSVYDADIWIDMIADESISNLFHLIIKKGREVEGGGNPSFNLVRKVVHSAQSNMKMPLPFFMDAAK